MAARDSHDIDPLVNELRTFILSYSEHDRDCPGIDANVWFDQLQVCTCGLAPRLDELMSKLQDRLDGVESDGQSRSAWWNPFSR
jgi:hypothetical protein